MAKPKKWNEMSPAEQAVESEARAAAKAARKTAERAALEAEAKGPGNKGNLALAAKAAKAPELPGARSSAAPDLPDRPLAGQGSMEGKPVEKVTVKVSDKLLTKEGAAKWNAANDADRRISQGSAPQAERRAALQAQKVMTPSGAIESTAPKAVPPAATSTPAGPLKMTAGDLFSEVSHARPAMNAGDIGLQTGKLSFKQRAARAAGTAAIRAVKWSGTTAGKAAIAIGKSAVGPIINPVREFRAGSAARTASWEAAGPVGKAVQTVATTAKVGWAGAKTAGGLARGAAYGVAASMGTDFAEHYGEIKAERQVEAEKRKEYGEKHGLKVSTLENPSLLRMTLGGSPKIKVHDTTQDIEADGKSLSQKRRERGGAKFQYDKLKKSSGRNIITSSYKPKGGSE